MLWSIMAGLAFVLSRSSFADMWAGVAWVGVAEEEGRSMLALGSRRALLVAAEHYSRIWLSEVVMF